MFGLKAYELALRKKGISVPVMEAALKLHKIYMESGFSSDDDAPEAVENDKAPNQSDIGDMDLTQLIDEQPRHDETEGATNDTVPLQHVEVSTGSEAYKAKNHKCAICGISTPRSSKYDAYTDGEDTHYTGDICDRCLADMSAAQTDDAGTYGKFDKMFNILTSNGIPHNLEKMSSHGEPGISTPGIVPEGFSEITDKNQESQDGEPIMLTKQEYSKSSPNDIHPSVMTKTNRIKKEMNWYKKYLTSAGESAIPNMITDKGAFFNRMQDALSTGDTAEFEKCRQILNMCNEVPTDIDPMEKSEYMNLITDAIDNDDNEAYHEFQHRIQVNEHNTRIARKKQWDNDLANRRNSLNTKPSINSDIDLGKAKDISYPLTMYTPGKKGNPVSTISGPEEFTTGYNVASGLGRQKMMDDMMTSMAKGEHGFLTPGSEDYNPMLAAKIAKNAPEDSPWGKALISELKDNVLPMASSEQKLDFIKDFPDADKLEVLKELAADPETAPLIDKYLGNNTTMSADNIIQLAIDSMPRTKDGELSGNVGDPENPQAQLVKIAVNLHSGNTDRKEIMNMIDEMSSKSVVAMFSLLTPEAVQKIIGCTEADAQEVIDGMSDPDMSDDDKKDLITENSSLYKTRIIRNRVSANKSIIGNKVKEAKNNAIQAYRTALKGQVDDGSFRKTLPPDMSKEEKDQCVNLAAAYAVNGDPNVRRKLVQLIHERG